MSAKGVDFLELWIERNVLRSNDRAQAIAHDTEDVAFMPLTDKSSDLPFNFLK